MKKIEIKIGTETYPVKFGFGAFQVMGAEWSLTGIDDVINKVATLVPTEGAEVAIMKFEVLNDIATVVSAGILNAGGGIVENSDIVDAMFDDMNILKQVFELFLASIPKPKESVKPDARKAVGKKKAPQKARAKS